MHALLRLQLHKLGLSQNEVPDAASWRALLAELSAMYTRVDDSGDSSSRSPSREMRFRMSQEPNRTVFEWCPAPLLLYNPKTLEILDVNAAATHAYGYSRDEFLSMRMADLKVPEEASALEGLAEGQIVRGGVERHRKKDGSLAEMSVTAHMMDFAGRSVVLGIFTDVTETRRLEEQLRQSQKMEAIGRLAGGIAHDFNNLIGAILSYAEICAQDLGATHPLTPDVLEIAKAAHRAAALTQQLLTFSRQQPYQRKLLSLNAIVADMERMLRRVLGEAIELTTVQAEDVGPIEADPTQIQQVLLNLTVNARDAMPAGGRLRIEVANAVLSEADGAAIGVTAGPYVRLSVRDTGVGMDQATRARVFEPFFTTKAVGAGTGLGLAIVFGAAKQVGGGVRIDSEPGRGATFEVYFPRAQGVVAMAASLVPARYEEGGAERVLLVDDDDQMRGAARRVLHSQGYAVIDVADPRAALDILRDTSLEVALVVTDVVMPHMDGWTLIMAAREVRPELRALYMSGYPELPGGWRPILAPEGALLRKPFSPRTLASAVRRALA
jgi:two-component system, cell cycle sensor histidine kinase and response regulator CckA